MSENNDIRNYIKDETGFNKVKKPSKLKKFMSGVAFVVIAAMSGVLGSYVFTSYNLKNINFNTTAESSTNSGNTQIITTSSKTWGNTINEVATKVSPAIVGISNNVQNFFGEEITQSGGTGIIFDSDGYIVTNNHVIDGAEKITVKLSSGKVYTAKVIGTDSRTDLAVIKIDGENFPTAKFGDSSKVKVGDIAIAIGNPLGEEFAGTVTSGIISATNRKMYVGESEYKLLQTDAAINPGNSGGALCNEDGEVIGINSLKIGADENAEGMGFAITINSAKNIIDSLMKYGQVARPELGIYGRSVQSQDGEIKGVQVVQVLPGSGAAKAGILAGDVIIQFDGKNISSMDELMSAIEEHKISDEVECKIWRNGKTKNIKVTLSDSSKNILEKNEIK